jgi:hypothetical protein
MGITTRLTDEVTAFDHFARTCVKLTFVTLKPVRLCNSVFYNRSCVVEFY